MDAATLWALVFIGAFLGALVTILHVLQHRDMAPEAVITTYLCGGAFGGAIAALLTLPADDISVGNIVVILLAGYFAADVVAAMAGVRRVSGG